MNFSKHLQLMIGKTARFMPYKWLPPWIHCIDTYNVISDLVDKRYYSLSAICGMDYDTFKKVAQLSALLHDIGKNTPLFQDKISHSLMHFRSKWEHYGINISHYSDNDYMELPHAKASECILLSNGFHPNFASVIGAHHGMPASDIGKYSIPKNMTKYYGNSKNTDFWNSLWKEWIEYSLNEAGFKSVEDIPVLNKRTQVLLCGLLILADWIASDIHNFPLVDIDIIPTEYDFSRVENAMENLKLPGIWEPETDFISQGEFYNLFGFKPNEIQKSIMKAVNQSQNMGICILEAPMGTGKTEASLAVASSLACKHDKHGLFFGLPTQATANSIFSRVLKWAEHQSEDYYHSINLIHKNSAFQPVFANIPKDMSQISVDDEDGGGLLAPSFFNTRKKACLSDFVTGTVDQMLMLALKRKHVMLRHLGFSQKVVIIDECHAYDAYMNCYLDTALAWLGSYGVPVILLSATLPVKRRNELICAYTGKKLDTTEDWTKKHAYPLLTWSDNNNVYQDEIPYNSKKRTVHILCKDEEYVLKAIEKVVEDGGCAGIICNTVRKAQHFCEIISRMENAHVILYHAQYIIPDRTEKENYITDKVGKNSTAEDRKGVIVIGTQVLEQSLDIDFDLLVTDICPMDLLLQRIGRMHRHEKHDADRPESLKQAQCIVMGTEEFEKASEKIYHEWPLLQTKRLLPEQITLPDDIERLVNEAYSEDISGLHLNEISLKAFQKYHSEIEDLKSKAYFSYCMDEPDYPESISENSKTNNTYDPELDDNFGSDLEEDNTLHGWISKELSGIEETEAEASVRNGNYSVEVLIMILYNNSIGFLPWQDKGKYIISDCPNDEDLCQKIVQQRVRLPYIFNVEGNIDEVITELERQNKSLLSSWQNSGWLKGELVLLLNENFTAELVGRKLSYSKDNGLSYEEKEEE